MASAKPIKAIKKVKKSTSSILSTVAPESIEFEVSDAAALWTVLSGSSYDLWQPFAELVDNAISAIITPGKRGKIYITFDFEKGVGLIEHSGGNTFPLDEKEVSRCFTMGGKKPTSLSEHGAGLKSSLAILDPENKNWNIFFKHVEDGELKIKKISAPYCNRMHIASVSGEWPGHDKTIENGTFITFPIVKARFGSLYATKEIEMKDLEKRIYCQLSHLWMLNDDILAKNVEIYYNGEYVKPFSFRDDDVYDKAVASIKKSEPFTLSMGGIVYVTEVCLKEGISKVPNSFKFKRAMTSNGTYLFKNGRLIEHINSDDAQRGNLYSRIFHGPPHNSHNGTIVLVNLVGDQSQLPATVPTKNRFQASERFTEFLDELSKNVTKLAKPTAETEDCIVSRYLKTNKSSLESAGIAVHYEKEHCFELEDGTKTPPFDLVRTIDNKVCIFEFKRNIQVSTSDLLQLMGNWMLASKSVECVGKVVTPTLILAASESLDPVPPKMRAYLRVFDETNKFKPEILDENNKKLYPIA